MVLANGDVIEANADSHSDLWLALKGGSNNFGIVTRIDVPTWSLGQMWGGSIVFNYTQDVLDAQAKAFSDFMNPSNFDDAADMGVVLIFQNPGGSYAVADSLFYVEPVENPPVYQPFTSIPGLLGSTMNLTNVGDLVEATGGTLPPDTRRYATFTIPFSVLES